MNNTIKTVYTGKIIRVIQKQVAVGDTIKTFEYAQRSPWVRLLVVNQWKILLNLEKRAEVSWGIDYRLPGGKVIDAIGDYVAFLESNWDILVAAQEAAKKELEEEAHISVNQEQLQHLHTSHAWATIYWDLYYFFTELSWDISQSKKIVTEEWEDIQTGWYSFYEVQDMCISGLIQEDRSVSVLLKFLLKRSTMKNKI